MRLMIDEMREVASTPGLKARQEAVAKLLGDWINKRILVQRVVNGETTFVKEITPLIQLNLHITEPGHYDDCDTEAFDEIARRAEEDFREILPLKVPMMFQLNVNIGGESLLSRYRHKRILWHSLPTAVVGFVTCIVVYVTTESIEWALLPLLISSLILCFEPLVSN